MKISILTFLCFTFLVLSSSKRPEKNFCITVTADSSLCIPKQYVYMYYLRYNDCYIEDSALLSIQNRKVLLYGCIPEQERVSLLFEKQGPNKVDIIATPGDSIHIHINNTDFQNVVMKKVIGSPATNEEADYFNHRDSLLQLRFSFLEKATVYQTDSIHQILDAEIKKIEEELKYNEIQSLKTTTSPYIAWNRAVLLSANDYGEDSVRKMKDEVMSKFPFYEKNWRLKPNRKNCPPGSDESRQNQARLSLIRAGKRALKSKNNKQKLISKDIHSSMEATGRYALWRIEGSDSNGVTRQLPIRTKKHILINYYTQHDVMDCGPTCLRMVAAFYGKRYSLERLREKSFLTREGVSMLGISEAAERLGFRTICVQVGYEKLLEAPLPCIVHWNQQHFVVVYKIDKKQVWVADPGAGKLKYTREEFARCWISSRKAGEDTGVTSCSVSTTIHVSRTS